MSSLKYSIVIKLDIKKTYDSRHADVSIRAGVICSQSADGGFLPLAFNQDCVAAKELQLVDFVLECIIIWRCINIDENPG